MESNCTIVYSYIINSYTVDIPLYYHVCMYVSDTVFPRAIRLKQALVRIAHETMLLAHRNIATQ